MSSFVAASERWDSGQLTRGGTTMRSTPYSFPSGSGERLLRDIYIYTRRLDSDVASSPVDHGVRTDSVGLTRNEKKQSAFSKLTRHRRDHMITQRIQSNTTEHSDLVLRPLKFAVAHEPQLSLVIDLGVNGILNRGNGVWVKRQAGESTDQRASCGCRRNWSLYLAQSRYLIRRDGL